MADAKRELEIVLNAKDNASDVLKGFGKSAENIASQMQKAGAAMIAIGAAPTAGLIGAAKAAIDFEDAFAGVRKTVDATEAEFQQLSQNFRNISKDTPLAVNELNRIGELAGSLGVSGVDNLTKFTKTIADIAITTNLTSEAAASAFGRIANIMQEPIENVDRMGATVVDLGNKFATTEAEITNFAERIAGAGKIAGLTTDEVFAIGAAMSSVGVEAEAGGTAVQKVLISMYQAASGATGGIIDNSKAIGKNTQRLSELKTSLQGAVMQQKEFGDKTKDSTKFLKQAQIDKYTKDISGLEQELGVLQKTHGQAAISANGFAKVLGVTNKQFTEMFKKDPAQVFEKFVLKLGEISKKGGDAAGVLDELELSDQRLMRAFLSLSNAGDLMTQTLNTSFLAWQNNTALQTEAEKRYATTASQIQIAKNNLYDLGITIGSFVLPAVNSILKAIKPMIESFAQFAADHPKLTTGLLLAGVAFGAIGTALVIIGTALPGIIVLFGGLAAIFTAITLPMVLIAAGIAAIGAAVYLLYLAWQSNWMGIRDTTDAFVQWFSTYVLPILQASFDLLKTIVGATIDHYVAKFRLAKDFTQGLMIFIGETMVPNIKKYFDQILGFVDSLTGGWVGKLRLIIDAFKSISGAIVDVINKINDLMKTATGKGIAGAAVSGFLSGVFKIPGFQHGGFVPGSYNQAVPAILHGGERVIPRNGTDVNSGGGVGAVTINFTGPIAMDNESRVQELAEKVISLLGRQNELAAKGVGF